MIIKPFCIIPARYGSKRLPRKNIISFLGKPIILYSIEAALESDLFSRIVVSTDDQEIASVAKSSGVEVIARPENLATDSATVVDVCIHALESLLRDNKKPDHFCCLYATSPLRRADDIIGSYELMISSGASAAMAVTHYSLPPWQAMIKDAQGFLRLFCPEIGRRKSQDVPEMFVDNGSTYWIEVATFLAQRTFYVDRMVGYWMPRDRSVDIDTETDLALADFFARGK